MVQRILIAGQSTTRLRLCQAHGPIPVDKMEHGLINRYASVGNYSAVLGLDDQRSSGDNCRYIHAIRQQHYRNNTAGAAEPCWNHQQSKSCLLCSRKRWRNICLLRRCKFFGGFHVRHMDKHQRAIRNMECNKVLNDYVTQYWKRNLLFMYHKVSPGS